MIDEVRDIYVNSDEPVSLRELGRRFEGIPGCSLQSIFYHSSREQWVNLREMKRKQSRYGVTMNPQEQIDSLVASTFTVLSALEDNKEPTYIRDSITAITSLLNQISEANRMKVI